MTDADPQLMHERRPNQQGNELATRLNPTSSAERMRVLARESPIAPMTMRIAMQSLVQSRLRFNRAVEQAVTRIALAGDWSQAVRAVIQLGGVSQAEFARLLKVDRSTVSRWMHGVNVPSTSLTQAYMQALQDELAQVSSRYASDPLVQQAIAPSQGITRLDGRPRHSPPESITDQNQLSEFANEVVNG